MRYTLALFCYPQLLLLFSCDFHLDHVHCHASTPCRSFGYGKSTRGGFGPLLLCVIFLGFMNPERVAVFIELLYFKGSIANSLWRLADVPRRARPSFFERIRLI